MPQHQQEQLQIKYNALTFGSSRISKERESGSLISFRVNDPHPNYILTSQCLITYWCVFFVFFLFFFFFVLF